MGNQRRFSDDELKGNGTFFDWSSVGGHSRIRFVIRIFFEAKEIFHKHRKNSIEIEYKDIPVMRCYDFYNAANEIEREAILNFLTFYMGDENNKLPDDLLEIVEIYLA